MFRLPARTGSEPRVKTVLQCFADLFATDMPLDFHPSFAMLFLYQWESIIGFFLQAADRPHITLKLYFCTGQDRDLQMETPPAANCSI